MDNTLDVAPALEIAGAANSTAAPMSLLHNLKIAIFHLGSAMADILISGVWNRIVIDELTLASTPIALLISLKYFVSPLSVWIGQRSDVTNLYGYRRLPYIWGGRFMIMLSYFLVGFATASLAESRNAALAWVGLIVGFVGFSLGSALSGTTFLSLIYDITPQAQRTRAISVVWFFLISGFAGAGILFEKLLPVYSHNGFLRLFILAPLIMGVLWVISLWGEERRQPKRLPTAAVATTPTAPPARSFLHDWRIVWNNTQARLFCAYLALTTMFFYTQDIILEPFGGEVFDMPVGTTSRFASYWGSMALLGIIISLLLTRYFPKRCNNVTLSRWGVWILVFTFALLATCAIWQIRPLVTIGLITMGLGLGLWTVGGLGLMMDMTRTWGAGIYLALWTVAETLARGVGTIVGGMLRDFGYVIFTGNHAYAYALVFVFQTLGFFITLLVLARVNLADFVQTTPDPEAVFAANMD